MRVIEYVILDTEEHAACRRVQTYGGYGLPAGPEREAEGSALGVLRKRNQHIEPEKFADAMTALRALHRRLVAESDPAMLEVEMGSLGAKVMAQERKYQAHQVAEAIGILEAGWARRHDERRDERQASR